MQLRNTIKSITGWIHATLLLAIVIPVIYAMGMHQEKSIENVLYYKSLLIIFPVIITSLAINKCRYLWNYLAVCILTIVVVGLFAWLLGPVITKDKLMWGYFLIIMVETLVVMVFRFSDRMHKVKSKEENIVNNPYWEPEYDLLNKPSFTGIIVFLIVYLVSKNFDNPRMCNTALVNSIIYLFTLVIYKYIDKTEEYLSLNNTLSNVPTKRIYGIGSRILAIFMMLLALSVLPSLFTINNRNYKDFRKWVQDREVDYSELDNEMEQSNKGTRDPMKDVIEENGPPKELPVWIKTSIYSIGIGIMVVLVIVIIKRIRETFHVFREVYDENGDIIEELKEADVVEEKLFAKKKEVKNKSERELIRRQYRKTIRNHRKVPPLGYETPLEIEISAGIADTKEGKELHVRYEKARYGE